MKKTLGTFGKNEIRHHVCPPERESQPMTDIELREFLSKELADEYRRASRAKNTWSKSGLVVLDTPFIKKEGVDLRVIGSLVANYIIVHDNYSKEMLINPDPFLTLSMRHPNRPNDIA